MADVLSRMMTKGVNTGVIKGIKIKRSCPQLSRLFFADDSLFFFRGKGDEVRMMKQFIQTYCKASRQEMNTNKFSVFFSANISRDIGELIHEILGIQRY